MEVGHFENVIHFRHLDIDFRRQRIKSLYCSHQPPLSWGSQENQPETYPKHHRLGAKGTLCLHSSQMLKFLRKVIYLPAGNNKTLPKEHPGLWVSTGTQSSSKQRIDFLCPHFSGLPEQSLPFFHQGSNSRGPPLSRLTTFFYNRHIKIADDGGRRCERWFSSIYPWTNTLVVAEQTLICREVNCTLKPQAGRGRVPFVNQNDV